MNKRPPAAYLVLIWRFLIMQENKQEKKNENDVFPLPTKKNRNKFGQTVEFYFIENFSVYSNGLKDISFFTC